MNAESKTEAVVCEVAVSTAEATQKFAAALAQILNPGEVLALCGDLGAGKTTFVQGLAEGLGVGRQSVQSPTFTLVNEYPGPTPLVHVDLYRIEEAQAQRDIGFDEILDRRDAIVAVEWWELCALPKPPSWIAVSIGPKMAAAAEQDQSAQPTDELRQIVVHCHGDSADLRAQEIARALANADTNRSAR